MRLWQGTHEEEKKNFGRNHAGSVGGQFSSGQIKINKVWI